MRELASRIVIVALLLGTLVSVARVWLGSGSQVIHQVPSSTRAIGSVRISPMGGMVMVYVPAGAFRMGSGAGDAFALNDEKPQREVYLDAYWIDRTEVTHAMYAAFLNERGNQAEGGDTWLDADDPAVRLERVDGTWRPVEGYADHPAAVRSRLRLPLPRRGVSLRCLGRVT